MANFDKAVEYTLADEGGHYEDPETCEISNFGISLAWLKTIDPDATAATVRNLSREAAIDLYRTQWWDKFHFAGIPSDRIATKLFDHAVNMGPVTAVKILQRTLNEPAETPEDEIDVDGVIGPQVARAVAHDCILPNGEQALLDAFAVNLSDHYEEIAKADPRHEKDLPGWLNRAEKLPTIAS